MQNMRNFRISCVTNYKEKFNFMVWLNSCVLLLSEASQNKSNVFLRLKWFWNTNIITLKKKIMFYNFVFMSFLLECIKCNKKIKSKTFEEKT